MALLDELDDRGLVADVTNRQQLGDLLAAGCVPVYAGYDPTASSLHVGHLIPTMLLKRFQLAGHRPIVVVGGATGMVGDPSGRSEERNLLDDATVATNVAGIRAQLALLLDLDDPVVGAVIVNNADWTRNVSAIEFLRTIGGYVTVAYMRGKDSVQSRFDTEAGISFTEFSYMLLQAFDFVELARSHGCRLQVGGSDQYGNVTAGCELSRKMGGPQLFGLSAPLLLDSTGAKMGKTSTGLRVWLDPERTSPEQFYDYFFEVSDVEVAALLRRFSLRPLSELDDLARDHDRDPTRRLAQRELARAMTSWVHGEDAGARADARSRS